MVNIKQIINEEINSILEDINKTSKQIAIDNKFFGPVYHGTTPETRDKIDREGFKAFVGSGREADIRNGYVNRDYVNGIPPPVHHLGYGVYFTTVKSIAKRFNVDTTRGLKEYYLNVPRIETINFASPKRMMDWWIKNGYDPELAEQSDQGRIDATLKLTNNLKSKYDAVWFKGKSIHKTLDGDQVVVFNPQNIFQVDPSLAKDLEIGSKVVRTKNKYRIKFNYDTQTGASERIVTNDIEVPAGAMGIILSRQEVNKQYHPDADKYMYKIKWNKGGTEFGAYDIDIKPYNKLEKIINEEIQNIFEVGEGNLPPYPYTLKKDASKDLIYVFETEDNDIYDVNLYEYFDNVWAIEFSVNKKIIDINKNKQYRIMSTILDIVKKFAEIKKPLAFTFSGSKTKGDNDNRRDNMYTAYIAKHITNDYELKKDGDQYYIRKKINSYISIYFRNAENSTKEYYVRIYPEFIKYLTQDNFDNFSIWTQRYLLSKYPELTMKFGNAKEGLYEENNLNEFNISETKDQWMWISPENEVITVPKFNHRDYIMRVYKNTEHSWDYDRVFDKAIQDGWVRAIYEYNRNRYKGALSLYGYNKNRMVHVLKNIFGNLIKYGNKNIFIDYERPKGHDVFSTFDSESKQKLTDFLNQN
jgi:hypothetical protein